MEGKEIKTALRSTVYLKSNDIIKDIEIGEDLDLKFGNVQFPEAVEVHYEGSHIGNISAKMASNMHERVKKYKAKYRCKFCAHSEFEWEGTKYNGAIVVIKQVQWLYSFGGEVR